VKVCTAFW